MESNDGTQKACEEQVRQLAAQSFADHVLVAEGEGRWYCGKPGTGIYSFRVVSAPYHVIVFGDIGDALLRVSDRNPVPWLRGAVRSPDYLISKSIWRDTVFYRGDAVEYLRDALRETEPSRSAIAVCEELNLSTSDAVDAIRLDDELDVRGWYEAWHDAGECEPPSCTGPSAGMFWTVEALRCFVRLLDQVPQGDSPMNIERWEAKTRTTG